MRRRPGLALLAGVVLLAGVAAPARAGDGCPDALITANVKTRLLADDGLGAFKINVETDVCVVTLNGCVDTRARMRRARSIAGKVRKVKAVKSNLTLCPADDGDEDRRKGD